jgi:gamma-glutamylputrescine oxidase
MDNLVKLMKEVLLPNTPFEIDTEWSGIMCFSPDGKDKTPILMKESENVIFAVRMNGMGVALASNVAVETCEMLYG